MIASRTTRAGVLFLAGALFLAGCSDTSSRYDHVDPLEPGYEQRIEQAPVGGPSGEYAPEAGDSEAGPLRGDGSTTDWTAIVCADAGSLPDGTACPETAAEEREPVEVPGLDRWGCFYDATWNEDWHDDVLCVGPDGASERPYLLEWDDFVTQDEIMAAAAEYEAQLNAR